MRRSHFSAFTCPLACFYASCGIFSFPPFRMSHAFAGRCPSHKLEAWGLALQVKDLTPISSRR